MRYRIIKIRNGLWRLEWEDGSYSEHSTKDGAEKMALQISFKHMQIEKNINLPKEGEIYRPDELITQIVNKLNELIDVVNSLTKDSSHE